MSAVHRCTADAAEEWNPLQPCSLSRLTGAYPAEFSAHEDCTRGKEMSVASDAHLRPGLLVSSSTSSAGMDSSR